MEKWLDRMAGRNSWSHVPHSVNSSANVCDYKTHVIATEIGAARLPVILFNSDAVLSKATASMRHLGETFHLTFKLVHTECKIVKALLFAYGFHEVHPNNPDFNLTWSNSHVKPGTLHSLTEFQKVNHFPRSFELTRKDRLYKNIQQMQLDKGVSCFDFLPQSFLIPIEYADFCNEFRKWRGLWIVKPLALSRGRGIYLVSRPDDFPVDEPVLVAKYIDNPFLINGYKFDLRLYVAVTSFDPLVIYLHNEGLARFATEKYKKGIRHLGNQCMHLTNYSVNRHSANYIRCYDPNVEDYGNKWSLSALMSYLERKGFNTTALCTQIKDIVIKSVVSAGGPIAAACKAEVPNHGNCFELFGFDILLDDTLRPWLLEINFSPSLACDLPLDLKIKSKVVADLLNLTGVVAHDPLLLRFQQKRVSNGAIFRAKQRSLVASSKAKINANKSQNQKEILSGEARILKSIHDEFERRGDFLRIFPTANTWDLYGQCLETRPSLNALLHKTLFPSVCKFTFTDVYKGSKALYSCLKPKVHSARRHSGKLEFAKKLVNAAFGKLDSGRTKSSGALDVRMYSSNSASKLLEGKDQLETSSTAESGDLSPNDCPVIRLLRMDETLSQVQARQAFALYLYRVGQKLDTVMSNEPVQHSRQSSLHFQQQLDLVLQFLNYASDNLAEPITIEPPDDDQEICDQGRHLLSQIDLFLEAYEDETESMWQTSGGDEREYFVNTEIFQKFIETAKACELEEVLMIVAEHHSTSWFIGTNCKNSSSSESPSAGPRNSSPSLGGLYHIQHRFFPQQSRSTHDCSALTDAETHLTATDDNDAINRRRRDRRRIIFENKGQSYSVDVDDRLANDDDNHVLSRGNTATPSSSFQKLCKAARIYTS